MLESRKFSSLIYLLVIVCQLAFPRSASSLDDTEFPCKTEPEVRQNVAASGNCISGEYYRRTYSDINDYLVGHVLSHEASPNVKAARDWLETESKKSVTIFKTNLLAALKQFTALANVPGKCDASSLETLIKNELATGARKHVKRSLEGPSKRIENIVYQYCLEHARECRAADRNAFESLYVKQVNPAIAYRVETFTDYLWRLRRFNGPVKNKCAELSRLFVFGPVEPIKEKRITYNVITQLAFDDTQIPDEYFLLPRPDPDTKKIALDKNNFVHLFNRYLVEPCEKMVDQLKQIVQIGQHNAFWFLQSSPNECSEEDAKFYAILAGYRICERLIRKDKNGLLKGVINLAEKMEPSQDDPSIRRTEMEPVVPDEELLQLQVETVASTPSSAI